MSESKLRNYHYLSKDGFVYRVTAANRPASGLRRGGYPALIHLGVNIGSVPCENLNWSRIKEMEYLGVTSDKDTD